MVSRAMVSRAIVSRAIVSRAMVRLKQSNHGLCLAIQSPDIQCYLRFGSNVRFECDLAVGPTVKVCRSGE